MLSGASDIGRRRDLTRASSRRVPSRSAPLLGALVAALLLPVGGLAGASQTAPPTTKPTIVLVHGAFADASGWKGVIVQLQQRGYPVIAPPNPLRSVPGDAAYLADFLKTLAGNIVLVGHSYGGFVMTNAAVGNPNVKALVYIAAFAPDQGDTVGGITAQFPGSKLGPARPRSTFGPSRSRTASPASTATSSRTPSGTSSRPTWTPRASLPTRSRRRSALLRVR